VSWVGRMALSFTEIQTSIPMMFLSFIIRSSFVVERGLRTGPLANNTLSPTFTAIFDQLTAVLAAPFATSNDFALERAFSFAESGMIKPPLVFFGFRCDHQHAGSCSGF